MDKDFDSLMRSWDEVNRAISAVLVAQPHQMSQAAAKLEVARLAHNEQVLSLSRSGTPRR